MLTMAIPDVLILAVR